MNEDIDMRNVDDSKSENGLSSLQLSGDEAHLLCLYDTLRELQVEMALLRSRELRASGPPSDSVRAAQDQLLESRASYTLRNDVVDAVISVNPILKAVHGATHATPLERNLLPFVEQRDAVSINLTGQSSELRGVIDELTKVEADSLRCSRANIDLASEVLRLAEEADREKSGSMNDSRTKNELDRLERDVKASRQKWKVMKGAASAIVAGSGVDWARNPALRDIVMDPE